VLCSIDVQLIPHVGLQRPAGLKDTVNRPQQVALCCRVLVN